MNALDVNVIPKQIDLNYNNKQEKLKLQKDLICYHLYNFKVFMHKHEKLKFSVIK